MAFVFFINSKLIRFSLIKFIKWSQIPFRFPCLLKILLKPLMLSLVSRLKNILMLGNKLRLGQKALLIKEMRVLFLMEVIQIVVESNLPNSMRIVDRKFSIQGYLQKQLSKYSNNHQVMKDINDRKIRISIKIINLSL